MRAARGTNIPLSHGQQRIWFLQQLDPASLVYHVPLAYRIAGPLDVEALRRSFEQVVHRHEALRTVFPQVGGEPHQEVTAPTRWALPVEDLFAAGGALDDAQCVALAEEELRRPFDLGAGPLIRTRLVRCGASEHLLFITLHHIVSDGWSLGILWRELGELYASFLGGSPAPLPALSLQYIDYALWQRAWLRDEELESQLAYWRQQLAGVPEQTELPIKGSRPPAQTFNGAAVYEQIDAALTSRIRELARSSGATLFMALLAGFRAVLFRYTGQQDLCIGTPITTRGRSELENVFGFFVNTLALRTVVNPERGFADLLALEKKTARGAFAHQETPFEAVVDALGVSRDLSRSPLFQTLFTFQHATAERTNLTDLSVSPVTKHAQTTTADISVDCWERDGTVGLVFVYNTDLFDHEMIAQLARHYVRLLAEVVAQPTRPIVRLELSDAAERHDLVVTRARGPERQPSELRVDQWFEAQARLTPHAIAVEHAGTALSYAELDRRANQLAHRLAALGVAEETFVGVCLERSVQLLVAHLAVLKAGGTYVPIDLEWPAERITGVVSDSGLRVLICDRALRNLELAEVTRVIAGSPELDAESAAPLAVRSAPSLLAYVMYTSGSTGRPKGVAVTHEALTSFLGAMAERPGLTARDVLVAVTTTTFDISGLELFLPVIVGARVVIASRDDARDGARLGRLLATSGATVMQATPASWTMLIESGWRGAPGFKALCGGEALPEALIQRLRPLVGELWNMYGPTETTIWSSVERVAAPLASLGQPIWNTQLYVLEPETVDPAPLGIAGELCIGGLGLARGYLGRPGLTAERFVPDPFAAHPGARMYRTGDLVRRRSDGEVAYLGRIDFQVKLRGFRIELGEIETALGHHAAVAQCVVVARGGAGGNDRLVGYVVLKAGAPWDAADARAHLRKSLPEYMVPSAFVVLDAMPLSAAGKVDRKALPAAEEDAYERVEYVAPRTPEEELLCQAWAEVLEVPRVGVDDHFFDLGGHSLLATQVLSRIRQRLGVELPLRVMFEAPTVAGLAAEIARRRAERPTPVAAGAIPRVSHDRPLPLSFTQQRLWFLHQLDPTSTAYNIVQGQRLRGRLDREVLRRALEEVIRRHDALRTVFVTVDDEPRQQIRPAGRWELTFEDLHGLDESAREAELQRISREEGLGVFELTRGPLVRTRLVRVNAEEHVLLFTIHHIVSDGWSMAIFWSETQALYAELVAGKALTFAPLPVQYADYAVWQRGYLHGEELDRQLAYWKDRLAGAPADTALPFKGPRPALQTSHGDGVDLELPAELVGRLRALGRRHDATLFMLLLAGLRALLYRYTGQPDLCIGTPIANRTRSELEGLIGFFANTLALRTQAGGEVAFHELVAREKETALGAHAHQETPFEAVVDALGLERSLSRSPIFQVLFSLKNMPRRHDTTSGLESLPYGTVWASSQFDLALYGWDGDETVNLTFNYNTDLFDRTIIEQLARHYRQLLDVVAKEPTVRLAAIPLLAADERRQLLSTWNATERDYTARGTLPALFEAQVVARPDAVALESGGTQLSYRELDARASQLAHHLLRRGVRPEDRVGVLLERGPELVVALLGVLKAGGAYVPMDPELPADRLALMQADSRMRLRITQESLRQHIAGEGVEEIVVGGGAVDGEPTTAPAQEITPQRLAYVMYTSGSTGRPKGVAVTHGALANFLCSMQEAPGLTSADALVAVTTQSFDISGLEMYLPLVAGGRVVMASKEEARDGIVLAGLLRTATALQATPATWSMLLDAGWRGDGKLKALCGGEALPAELADRLRAAVGQLWNVYGPTETTIWSSRQHVQPGAPIRLGEPIANTELHVLEPDTLEPAPLGVAGELYIGGEGLARGYFGQPKLTAERFVPDPYAAAAGARMYRTGDLARRLPDGSLEYLGRIDFQVKVRGYRIELGEIESVLGSHPSVSRCVVVARDAGRRGKQLVAYVVGARYKTPDIAVLREHLQTKLPEYMVPSAFMTLEALPLSPAGKVDRKALPALTEDAFERDEYVAPRSPEEAILAGIWEDVLDVARVGVHDDFFALGGHSLLATQVVSRVRKVVGCELPLRALFEARTVAALAGELAKLQRGSLGSAIVATPRAGLTRLSYTQERLWFLHQLEPDVLDPFVAGGYRMRGALDVEALRRALEELVRRHEALRTTFVVKEGVPLQQIHNATRRELAVSDVQPGEADLRRLIDEVSLPPFDLERGPLIRTHLFRIAPDDHLLVVAMHHVISDGWSLGVVWREIKALYTAFSSGAASGLPALPLQYADFAAWQRSPEHEAELAEQLGYWTDRLTGAPTDTPLPLRKPRRAGTRGCSETTSLVLDAGLSERLRELGRVHGATTFMLLLAGFRALVARYTGQTDLCIGTMIANRNRGEVESLVGFFANTIALRSEVDLKASFVELVAREKEVALGAYAHQDMPIERILQTLAIRREVTRTPLFQILFVHLNMPDEKLSLPDLEVEYASGTGEPIPFYFEIYSSESDGVMRADFRYDPDVFDAATVDRLLRHYERLLDVAAAAPHRPLFALPLLADGERQSLLATGAPVQVRTSDPADGCIHQLFEAQVDRSPGAIAVRWRDGELSYAELDARANRLANRLCAAGVGAESIVGLYVDRTPEMLVGMLGILKAGAAYLPLDPALPGERMQQIARDARVTVVVKRAALAPPPLSEVLVIDADELTGESGRRVPGSTAANVAYVLYTSGSTGTPKGVAVTHGSLVSYVRTALTDYQLSPADRVLQFAAFSWDTSCEEIYPTLASGGSIVLRDAAMLDSSLVFLESCRQFCVTILNLPTAFWHGLVASASAEQLASGFSTVRLLIIGGEAAAQPRIEQWRTATSGRVRLVNTYGMTEATAVSTLYDLAAPVADANVVPIGRPVANTRVYVLDRALEPAPLGVAGELFIGGAGVARGYVARPALTAERFVPDPFGPPGSRLYRSGDLARFGVDGVLEYFGRADHQVKIRGFRVELGEVEAALVRTEGVREAVAVAREDVPGDKRIVAYLVGDSARLDANELRGRLERRLPDYMVPSAFVILDRIPLTPHGKLDRKALPAPDFSSENPYVAPSTSTEIAVAKIFSEILEVPEVGASDDFFELGGHSLTLLRLLARIASELGAELTLAEVFDRPTVAALAEQIDRMARADAPSRDDSADRALAARVAALSAEEVASQLAEWSTVMLETTPTPTSTPLSDERRQLLDRWVAMHGIDANPVRPLPRLSSPTHRVIAGQRLHWDIHERGGAGGLSVQSLAAELRGPLNVRAMQDACSALVARHDALRTVLTMDGGRLAQTVRNDRYEVELVDLSSLPADERVSRAQRLFEAENRSFDLRRSVFHAKLVRIDEHHHLIVGALHHITGDGGSVMPLVGDLAALYRAHVADREADLPSLPFSFNDFCFWQNTLEERPVGRAQLDFWERTVAHFEGRPVLGDLRNVERGAVGLAPDTNETAAVPFACQGPAWQALSQMCGRVKCTPYTAFATAFSLMLCRWAESSDVLLMSSMFHRNRPGSEVMIGNFSMPYPLRVRFDNDATLEQAVVACHRAVLAQRENAHVAPTTALPMWTEWSRYNLNYQIAEQTGTRPDFGGLQFKPLPWTAFETRGPFDLGLFVLQMPSGVFGRLGYNKVRFSPELGAQIAACVAKVLDLLATAPDTRISELPRGPWKPG